MKLRDTFITYTAGEEHTMVATEGFSGVVRSNKTAAFIIEKLKSPSQRRRSWTLWRRNTTRPGQFLKRTWRRSSQSCAPSEP